MSSLESRESESDAPDMGDFVLRSLPPQLPCGGRGSEHTCLHFRSKSRLHECRTSSKFLEGGVLERFSATVDSASTEFAALNPLPHFLVSFSAHISSLLLTKERSISMSWC
jgi:hypothetical protein